MERTDCPADPLLDGSSADQPSTHESDREQPQQALEGHVIVHESVFFDNPIPALVYGVEDLRILHANHSAARLYGYSLEQFRRMHVKDLFAAGSFAAFASLDAELRKPLNSFVLVDQHTASGEQLVVNLISFAFETNERNARVLIVEDKTGRQNTEEALRSSEERFRELFENANDVIFLHNLQGTILEINRAAEHLTGYSRHEVLGNSFADLVAPEARHLVMDIVRIHLGGGTPQHHELPVLSKSGMRRYLEVSTRLTYRRGQPVAIQGIGRDVTERKQAEEKLLRSAKELQMKNEELSTALELAREATRLKEQFLANTSHELRTPMNGIMGMVNLLKSTELTTDQREYADVVSQCANDLLTIINDLLDLSQIEARRLTLNDEAFDVRESLRGVVKLLRPRASDKELSLTCEIDPQLPQYLYGDSVRFRQILTNLIANAVKFTLAGGVHIWVGPDESGSLLRCQVIDSGIGVEDSIRDRIFEAFFQADGTNRRRFGGTGLGLTICKQLVETMHGRIGINNNITGAGSTFWFEIPLRSAVDRSQANVLPS